MNSSKKFPLKSDWLAMAALFLLNLLSLLPCLGSIEFLRHTEADRVLIAWEMLERRSFIVPYLLGDLYLTKPPLYYDLLALVFAVVGEPQEWAARLVSAIASSLLVVVQFAALRLAGWTFNRSAAAALMLASCAQFLRYALVAEIDMTFCLFAALALFAAYFSFCGVRKWTWTLATYFFAAAAFLIKGPPIIIFLGSGVFFFALAVLIELRGARKLAFAVETLQKHFACCWIFAVVCTVWILLLLKSASFEHLQFLFERELLNRFSGQGRPALDPRGTFFYFNNLLVYLLPWSPLLIGYFVAGRSRRDLDRASAQLPWDIFKSLLIFALSVIVPSLLFFSMSAGKASRYIFPLLPFCMIIVVDAAVRLKEWRYQGLMIRFLKYFSAAGLLAGLLLSVFYSEYHNSVVAAAAAFFWLLPFLWLLILSLRGRTVKYLPFLTAFACCFIALRIPYAYLYSPLRNQKHSVKSLVKRIELIVPPAEPIYILELPQRWLAYYLVKQERKVQRLTPELAAGFKEGAASRRRLFVLINAELEDWRLRQIRGTDPSVEVLAELRTPKVIYLLFGMDAAQAHIFEPQQIFPTEVSLPRRSEA